MQGIDKKGLPKTQGDSEVGDKEVREALGSDAQAASYTIIAYPGRELPKNYEAMIYSKWLRSLRYGNDYFKLIDSASYYATYHTYIERILSLPSTMVRLAVLSNDPDCVFGYAVHRGTTLDYVHVQKDYRRKTGIALSLIPKDIDTITHLTKDGMSFWNSYLPQAKFNPFA